MYPSLTTENTPSVDAFRNIYPDVDPAVGLPLTVGERIAIAVAVATLVFGGATGNLIVGAAGLAFVLFCAVAQTNKPQRRIRAEARGRFPNLNWYENTTVASGYVIPSLWLLIIAGTLAAWWFTPVKYLLHVGVLSALVAALIIWFMPGLNPIWTARRAARQKPDQPASATAYPHDYPHAPDHR